MLDNARLMCYIKNNYNRFTGVTRLGTRKIHEIENS